MTHRQRIKLTQALERGRLKELQGQYRSAYKTVRKELADFAAKYSVDGKLSLQEAQKFNRLQNLEKLIDAELAKITAMNAVSTNAYLISVYELNYFYTGYILETQNQIKLAFGQLNKNAVKAAIENPLDKIAALNNKAALKQQVHRAITQGVVQGQGVRETAASVRRAMEINARSAERIVRTETARATGQASLDSMEHAEARGLPIQKEWLAALDGRTRDSHASLDGEVRDISQPFSNGLMYPGDYSGSAAEVVNCRCTMTEKIKDVELPPQSRRAKENGDYSIIPKMSYTEWQKTRVK